MDQPTERMSRLLALGEEGKKSISTCEQGEGGESGSKKVEGRAKLEKGKEKHVERMDTKCKRARRHEQQQTIPDMLRTSSDGHAIPIGSGHCPLESKNWY